MKLLIVLSSKDFDNFTRRATVEAICEQHPDTTLLFFNGIKGFPIHKPSNKKLTWKAYYSLSLGKGKNALRKAEIAIAGIYWKKFIRSFDTVFLTDPNQELLLDFLILSQRIAYLVRDPNVLLGKNNYIKEERILKKNPHVFGISKALCEAYVEKHYGHIPIEVITYWPNTVDLKVWSYQKPKDSEKINTSMGKVAGVIGNITFKTDFELLRHIALDNPDVRFVVFGKILLPPEKQKVAADIFSTNNIDFQGYVPFEALPAIVAKWDIGLVIEKSDMEFSRYYDANKRYQYVAMGLPFVSYVYNDECKKFGKAAFIANTKEEYSQKIKEALAIAGKPETIEHCLQVALENSSEVRAREFLEAIQK